MHVLKILTMHTVKTEFQIEMNNLFTQFEFEKEKKKQHK